MRVRPPFGVIPAKAGTHEHDAVRNRLGRRSWFPAFAGMTLCLLLAACDRAEAPANNQAAAPANSAQAPVEGDVAVAERLVRERLGNPQGLVFGNPLRTASEGVTIICGDYARGAERQRFIVVGGEDAFLEPELQPGEMDRYFTEFCAEGQGNRPPPVAPQGNSQ